jgi:hypothetical protein
MGQPFAPHFNIRRRKFTASEPVIHKEDSNDLGKNAELEAELAKVRAAAPPPQKIYKYLRRVYRLRRKLTKTSEWQDTLRDFGNAHHRQISTNYIRLIIQLTAPHVTTGMKHKYTAALQYALEKGIKSDDLEKFIKEQGLNECVELWSKKYGRSAVKKQPKKKSAK